MLDGCWGNFGTSLSVIEHTDTKRDNQHRFCLGKHFVFLDVEKIMHVLTQNSLKFTVILEKTCKTVYINDFRLAMV